MIRRPVCLAEDEVLQTHMLGTLHMIRENSGQKVAKWNSSDAPFCFWRYQLAFPETLRDRKCPILEVDVLPLQTEQLSHKSNLS